MDSKYIKGGEIFCIPLFWINETYNPKNKLKLSKDDESKSYFCEAIDKERQKRKRKKIAIIYTKLNVFAILFSNWIGTQKLNRYGKKCLQILQQVQVIKLFMFLYMSLNIKV